MKKPIIFIIIILIVVFLITLSLITNFTKKKINEKLGENVMEKVIEKQTGAKVDIDSNSDGKNVTIKTEDGQTQYSADGGVKLPDGFPQELIVVDDAKLILSSSSSTGSSVTYLTNLDQNVLFEKYITDLPILGWTKDTEINMGEGKLINFSKNNEAGVITIGDSNSNDQTAKTTVNVIWTVDSNE